MNQRPLGYEGVSTVHSGRHPTERAGVYASPFRPVWSSVGRSTRKVHGKFDRRQPSSSRAPQVWRCLPLEPLAPVSIRWLQENLGKHRCQCGCGLVIDLQARHYRHVIPRFTHGHHNRRGHWRVLQLREAGYLTISEVAKALGIGTTTLRRREGTIYPQAARSGGIRVYHAADVELFRRLDEVPPTAAGGKQPWRCQRR